jgi:hypothetical protein
MKLKHACLFNSYVGHVDSYVAENVSDLVSSPSSALKASNSCSQSRHIVKHAARKEDRSAWQHLEISRCTSIGPEKDADTKGIQLVLL